MARLNDEQIKTAKAWIHDIFVAGGIYPNPKRAIASENYPNMYGTGRDYNHSRQRPLILNQAKILCDAIKNRKVDVQLFKAYDEALNFFSKEFFWKTLGSTYSYDAVKKPASMLAKYISWFCSSFNQFVWYDGDLSTYEKDEIKNTILGNALTLDNCFESQQQTTSTTPKTTTPRATSTGNAGQPQNNFKSTGGLSSKAVNLISTPGQKEFLSAPVYCIAAIDASNKTLEDTLYIRPVEATQQAQEKYMVNGTNKVLFGKAKGYGYCTVYFNDYNEATKFMNAALTSGMKLKPEVAKLEVAKVGKVLPNGYFKIGTEFGPVYISASKLNEQLTEEAEPEQPKTHNNKEKWERYEEAFFHEM